MFLDMFSPLLLFYPALSSSSFRTRSDYSKEFEGYKGSVRTREEKIDDLEDNFRELMGDLEKSHLSHASTNAAFHPARMEYGRVFEEKEALMLEGFNQWEQIRQLQKEVSSTVHSYKESEEF